MRSANDNFSDESDFLLDKAKEILLKCSPIEKKDFYCFGCQEKILPVNSINILNLFLSQKT